MKRILKFINVLLVVMLVIMLPVDSIATEETLSTFSNRQIDRISGNNRFETAVNISKSTYDKSDVAILASDTGQADALTGTILAHEKQAPLLLVNDKISNVVLNELKRIDVKDVYILGGPAVVSNQIENQIKKSYNITRLAGANRAETAIKISNEIPNTKKEYFLTLGYGTLADALSIGPVSAREKTPVLLTATDKMPKETLDKIVKDKPDKITIIGGFTAVSKNVENQIPKGITIERVSGSNRMDTSMQIAKRYYGEQVNSVILANGFTMIDALTGGYLSANKNMPIILSQSNKVPENVVKYLGNSNVTILGGEKAIESNVKNILLGIETTKPTPTPTPVPEVNLKAKDRPELKSIISKQMKDRNTKTMEVKYYGGDIKTSGDFRNFILDVARTNTNYNMANAGAFWMSINKENPNYVLLTYRQDYRTTDAQEKLVNDKANSIIKNIIKPGMTQKEKVLTIHDYIVNNTTYTKNSTNPYSAYSVLLENKGVCNGYVLALSKLLNAVEIDNLYVMGTAVKTGGLHAWNKVKIDNVWYNIDVTWSHPLSQHGLHNAYYHFLNSDERFYKTHTPISYMDLPKSTSKTYDGKYDNNFDKKGSFMF